jgi:hypothetical protein
MACSNPGVILSAFERETGLPVLVNTSFNVHEEPIVNTPAECIKALRDAPHRLCRDGSRALRLPAGVAGFCARASLRAAGSEMSFRHC